MLKNKTKTTKKCCSFRVFYNNKIVTFCKFQFILHTHLYLKNLTSYYTYSNISMTYNQIV